jgi:hypothetical protein
MTIDGPNSEISPWINRPKKGRKNGFSEIVHGRHEKAFLQRNFLKKKAKDLKISLSVKALLHMIPVKGSERYHVQATL